jgi:purine-binding chemotaxis protein CheW
VTPASNGAGPREDVVELCAFRVGDEEYVIDLRRIREILQPGPVTSVPRAPDGIEGVMSVRGDVIPVVDVRKRLGVTPQPRARSKVLVVTIAGRVLGLIVDAVIEVVRTPRSAIGPAPLLVPGPRLFLGVCGARERRPAGLPRSTAPRGASRLRLLLNVKALLEAETPERAAASRRAGVGDPS